MNTNKIFKISLATALIFSGYMMVASAQTSSTTQATGDNQQPVKITFPIAELGNCGSTVECRSYCNKLENMDACTNFATTNGLISLSQREQNKKFVQAMKNGGPGQCKTADSCKTYCADSSHADECLAFAQNNNLVPKVSIDQSKKVNELIKNGGPGGCSSAEACKTYCAQADHFQVCTDFAQKNGLVSGENLDKLKKFNELVQGGLTPGKCQTKDACETYCQDPVHKQECVDFAAKMGALTQDQAGKIKNITAGPGSCNSKDSCDAYCNDQAHHDECLKFAQDNGLIKPGDAEKVKTAIGDLKQGLNNAPESLKKCIKNQLGADVYEQIAQGQFAPTSEVGKKISACFAQNKPQSNSTQKPEGEKVTQCILQKLNLKSTADLAKQGLTSKSPEVQTALKACLEQVGQNPPQTDNKDNSSENIGQCIKSRLGSKYQDVVSGKISTTDPSVQEAKKACGYKMQPPMGSGSGAPSGQPGLPPKAEPDNQNGKLPPPPQGMNGQNPPPPQGQGSSQGNYPQSQQSGKPAYQYQD